MRKRKQNPQKPQKKPRKAHDLDLGSAPSSKSDDTPPRSPIAPNELAEPVPKAPGGGNRKLRVGDPSLPEIW
jgi:hypothetical protein